MFTLTIETGNAAFQGGPEELARIVERVAGDTVTELLADLPGAQLRKG